MNASDYAGMAASVAASATAILMGLRWLVRVYLKELLPNGGSSLADRIKRIEDAQIDILLILNSVVKSSQRRTTNAAKKKASKTKRS